MAHLAKAFLYQLFTTVFYLSVFFSATLIASESIEPWFTRPIVAGGGTTIPAGHWQFRPHVFGYKRFASFNNQWDSQSIVPLWSVQERLPVWFGLTSWWDVKLTPIINWSYRNHQAHWSLGDWYIGSSIQLHRDATNSGSIWPSIKIGIRETFPTGKYQKLNPLKLGTDSAGLGCWRTSVGLFASKILQIRDVHFLQLYFNAIYAFAPSIHVAGFNAYGGGYGTKGTIFPNQTLQLIWAFEYSLTRKWAIACDFLYQITSKTEFSGNPGTTTMNDGNINPRGVPAKNVNMASVQYRLAPAIEYNWSKNLGLISGVLFTAAGKNCSDFITLVVALNYFN